MRSSYNIYKFIKYLEQNINVFDTVSKKKYLIKKIEETTDEKDSTQYGNFVLRYLKNKFSL
jgi:hypothetical protein